MRAKVVRAIRHFIHGRLGPAAIQAGQHRTMVRRAKKEWTRRKQAIPNLKERVASIWERYEIREKKRQARLRQVKAAKAA